MRGARRRRRSAGARLGGRRPGALTFGRAEGQHAQQRHLEPGARAGRELQVAAAVERHLVPQLHHFRTQLRGQRVDIDAIGLDLRLGHQLSHLDPVQCIAEGLQHAAPIRSRGLRT